MKRLLLLLWLVVCPVVNGAYVPTPDLATEIGFQDDPEVKWVIGFANGSRNGVIMELVPEGQKVEAWKEMVANQIFSTKDSLEKHIKDWKAMVREGDPNVEVEEVETTKDSVTLIYRSKSFNEYSIRKFMKGSDGIYVAAFHSRLRNFDQGRADLWKKIISEVTLTPNPVKGK